MIKWNEVTWYSRLGALILFLAVIPVLCFYIGTQYELTSISVSTPPRVFIPIPTQPSTSFIVPKLTAVAPNTNMAGVVDTKKAISPDGTYMAVSQSDEQGDAEVYLQNASGTLFTPAYCGFYYSWATTSQKIMVFVPSECLTGSQQAYFYLYKDGTVGPVEGSSYVPNAQ